MVGMGPDVEVLAVHRSVRDVAHEARPEPVVARLGERLVGRSPPDLRPARRLVDDELVLWRAPRVLAGPDHERPVRGDEALGVAYGVLVELGDGEVAVDR